MSEQSTDDGRAPRDGELLRAHRVSGSIASVVSLSLAIVAFRADLSLVWRAAGLVLAVAIPAMVVIVALMHARQRLARALDARLVASADDRREHDALRAQLVTLKADVRELTAENGSLEEQRRDWSLTRKELIEQREALAERSATMSRFALTLEATPDLVLMVGIDGTLLYQNPAAMSALHGVSLHRGLALLRYLSRDAARIMRFDVLPIVMERGVWQGELDIRQRNGELSPTHITVIAQRDRFECPEVFVVIGRDISEERRLREALAVREALHRSIIDALSEGVLVQNRHGEIIAWNESAAQLLGLTDDSSAAQGLQNPQLAASAEDGTPLDADTDPIARARLHGERTTGQIVRIVARDGQHRELSVNAQPMYVDDRDDLDDRPGAVATIADISSQRALHREMERLSVVVRQSEYAVVMTDASARITWVNHAFEQLTGYAAEEVQGQSPGALLQGAHTSADAVSRMRAAIHQEVAYHGELLNYRRNGSPYWVEVSITPLHDTGGGLTGFVGLSRDVTARRAADRERQTMAAALEVAADGVAILDVGGTLEFVNHAFARQAGATAAQLLNQPWLGLYDSSEAELLTHAMRTDLKSLGFWHGEVRARRSGTEHFPQDVSLTLLPQGGVVAVVRDISERRAAEDRLKFLSTRDELTGLLNRRGFLQAADGVLRDASARGRSCALLYGDLDSFKLINDRFGHPTGDLALQEIAQLLSHTFRSSDLIARLGGDEFTVLACDVGEEEIGRVLARLDASVQAHNAARAHDPAQAWVLGVSLGVAFAAPHEPIEIDDLLRAADAAQYERKSARKATRKAA